MGAFLLRVAPFLTLLATASCFELDASDDEGGSDSNASVESGGASGAEPGSEDGCAEWRSALGEECAPASVGLSEEELATIACVSASDAAACAAALTSAGCDEDSLQGCGILDIADRSAAYEQCEHVIGALCERAVECGQYSSGAACAEDASVSAFDCSEAIGWRTSSDECVLALGSLSCSAWQLPTPCLAVITTATSL